MKKEISLPSTIFEIRTKNINEKTIDNYVSSFRTKLTTEQAEEIVSLLLEEKSEYIQVKIKYPTNENGFKYKNINILAPYSDVMDQLLSLIQKKG